MNEPERTEWQIRCAFNGFCKRTLKNESINAHKELKKRQAHEISFPDLTPKEENQLYTCEDFFAEDKEEQTFFAGGKELSAKLIADAIHSFFDKYTRKITAAYHRANRTLSFCALAVRRIRHDTSLHGSRAKKYSTAKQA